MKNLLLPSDLQQLRQPRDFVNHPERNPDAARDIGIRFADFLDNALSTAAHSQYQPDYRQLTQTPAPVEDTQPEDTDGDVNIDAFTGRRDLERDESIDDDQAQNAHDETEAANDKDVDNDDDNAQESAKTQGEGDDSEQTAQQQPDRQPADAAPTPANEIIQAGDTQGTGSDGIAADNKNIDAFTQTNDAEQTIAVDSQAARDLNAAVSVKAAAETDGTPQAKDADADGQNLAKNPANDIQVTPVQDPAQAVTIDADGQEQLPVLPQTPLQLAQSLAARQADSKALPNGQAAPSTQAQQLNAANTQASQQSDALPVEKLTVTKDTPQSQFQPVKNLHQPLRANGEALLSSQELTGSGSQLLQKLKAEIGNGNNLNQAVDARNAQNSNAQPVVQAASLVTQTPKPQAPTADNAARDLNAAQTAQARPTQPPQPQTGGDGGRSDAQPQSQPNAASTGTADNAPTQAVNGKFAAQLASNGNSEKLRSVHNQLIANIQKGIKDGKTRIQIQLNPPELGRVEVQIQADASGRLQLVIAPEKADTLELLQRDVNSLQQVLQDAGLDVDSQSLTFLLREQFAQKQRQQNQQPSNSSDDDGKEQTDVHDNDETLDEWVVVSDDGRVNARV